MLRHPAMVSRAPDGQRRPSAFLVTGSQNIQKGFAAAQHPSPVLSDLFDVRSETRGLVRIEKAGSFVEIKELTDGDRIHLHAVRLVQFRQTRQLVYDLLILRV